MSAQEEMMHSLLHNLSQEFSSYVDLQKETSKKPARYQRKATTTEQGSYLDEKAKSVYEHQ